MFWNKKVSSKNVHCTNFTNTLNDFVVQISEKELIFSDKYFNGNLQ